VSREKPLGGRLRQHFPNVLHDLDNLERTGDGMPSDVAALGPAIGRIMMARVKRDPRVSVLVEDRSNVAGDATGPNVFGSSFSNSLEANSRVRRVFLKLAYKVEDPGFLTCGKARGCGKKTVSKYEGRHRLCLQRLEYELNRTFRPRIEAENGMPILSENISGCLRRVVGGVEQQYRVVTPLYPGMAVAYYAASGIGHIAHGTNCELTVLSNRNE